MSDIRYFKPGIGLFICSVCKKKTRGAHNTNIDMCHPCFVEALEGIQIESKREMKKQQTTLICERCGTVYWIYKNQFRKEPLEVLMCPLCREDGDETKL